MAIGITVNIRNRLLDYGFFGYNASVYGTLTIFDGSRPAAPGGTVTNALVSWNSVIMYTAAAGVAAFNPTLINGGGGTSSTAVATGVASWGRLSDGAGGDIDLDVTVTAGGGDLEINDLNITNGDNVNLTALSLTMPAA